MFLGHLNDQFYGDAIIHFRLAILNCTKPLQNYLLPKIVTTIDDISPHVTPEPNKSAPNIHMLDSFTDLRTIDVSLDNDDT